MEPDPRCCLCGETLDISDIRMHLATFRNWIIRFTVGERTNYVHTVCEFEMLEFIQIENEANPVGAKQ